jgi:hypothetical protein
MLATEKRKSGPPASPTTLKKRRVLEEKSTNVATPVFRGKGSQPAKSSFEEDLNRLTQEIDQVGDCTPPISHLRLLLCFLLLLLVTFADYEVSLGDAR